MDPAEPTDPLAELRERLRAAEQAAERAAGEGRVPPQGWAVPRPPGEDGGPDDLAALVALLHALRHLVPPELHAQLTDTTRQILVLVRALIDRWLELLERSDPARDTAGDRPAGGDGPEVEDIPIQ